MAWEHLSPLGFLAAGHLTESEPAGDPGDQRDSRTPHRLPWWLVGIMTAVAGYFAVQFTGQVRTDVADLQRARTAAEATHAAEAAAREGIRLQLSTLIAGINRLEDKIDQLEERTYNGKGKP